RDVRVPAVFLWPKLTSDVRANAPLQKLRLSLLLFLQLLALLLLVLGMAEPVRRARGLSGHATVVVMDASASMDATDVSPTRFEAARRRVAALIGSMGAGDRLALIEAGPLTRVVFPLSSDKGKMNAALGGLSPTDSPANMGEALRLASALVGQEAGGRIVLLSDGDFPAVTDFTSGRAQVVYETIGKSGRNLGVTAFDSAPLANGALQLFAGIHNYDTDPMAAVVTFVVDGQIADARNITVPAGQTVGESEAVPGGSRRAEVHLAGDGDILPADNKASLYLQGAGTIRTLLVSPGDLFLERALALEPSIQLDRAPAVPPFEQAGGSGAGQYDLVVFDGVPAQAVKAPAVLSFGSGSADLPVTETGISTKPHVVSWVRDDPVLTDADLSDLMIQKAETVKVKPAGKVLAVGSDGPLIVSADQGGRRSIYVGFGLLDSDFPLRIGFPIFIDNAVHWLTGQGSAGLKGGLNIRAGQPFSVAVPGNAGSVSLAKPDGSRDEIPVVGGMATVRAADRVGDYKLTGGGVSTPIAVNLLSEDAGAVTPRLSLSLSGHPVAGVSRPAVVLAEIWRPLILAALIVLGIEWWVFVRRS
ncbi:MAG TPA: VWA domain-containing protein, partial [Capsulimonadaceae bacterium]|nr:VWA domain-containing protein [Capsulimonadaceae bacterium]